MTNTVTNKIARHTTWLALAAAITLVQTPAFAKTILFVGNSFTFGAGSPVHHFHPETVTDLNGDGVGGVPALFKAFTKQAGLTYDVSLETSGGKNFDFHYKEKRKVLDKPWDEVILQAYSTLDEGHPGNPAMLVQYTRPLVDVFYAQNPAVKIYMTATWSRADLTYPDRKPWTGKPIEQMALDVQAAYQLAASTSPLVAGVIPVGLAWNRAFKDGVADPNPYDGLTAGKVNLWTDDNYHASAFGYYLEALMVFGNVTGLDPAALGEKETTAVELGFSAAQIRALQKIAHDELTALNVKLGPIKR